MPLATGGGIQVAIAFLDKLSRQRAIEWKAVVPRRIVGALPTDLVRDPRVQQLTNPGILNAFGVARALRAIETECRPDVVFTVFGPARFKPRAPHLVGFARPHMIYPRVQGLDSSTSVFGTAMEMLRIRSFKQADHLVVETATVRSRLVDWLGLDAENISVIGNAVNPLLVRSPEAVGVGSGLAVDRGTCRILVPSAYYRHKNLEIIPQVAAALARLHPALDFEFCLTLDAESPEWRAIASDSNRRGVGHRVSTLGVLHIAHLGHAYEAASAIYLPTIREASTAVYPESFFYRRPVVTSDLDFARELCGDAARYVPPFDAEASASALSAVALDPLVRDELVSAGIRRLETSYPSAEKKFDLQIELLDRVAYSGTRADSKTARSPAIELHERLARGWDDRYSRGGFRRRAHFFQSRIAPHFSLAGPWLDAGCGSGYFSRLLAARGVEVLGVDGSAQMIEFAREAAMDKDRTRFEVLRIEALAQLDQTFEGAMALSVLGYLADPMEGLKAMTETVRPGGQIVVSVPNRGSAVRRLQALWQALALPLSPDARSYLKASMHAWNRRDLRRLFERAGLDIDLVVSFDPIVPRLLSRVVSPSMLFVIARRR